MKQLLTFIPLFVLVFPGWTQKSDPAGFSALHHNIVQIKEVYYDGYYTPYTPCNYRLSEKFDILFNGLPGRQFDRFLLALENYVIRNNPAPVYRNRPYSVLATALTQTISPPDDDLLFNGIIYSREGAKDQVALLTEIPSGIYPDSWILQDGRITRFESGSTAYSLQDVVTRLSFDEKWSFSTEKGTFTKEILGLGIVMSVADIYYYSGETSEVRKTLFGEGVLKIPAYTKKILPSKRDARYIYRDKNLLSDSIVYETMIATTGEDLLDHHLAPRERYELINNLFTALANGSCKAFPFTGCGTIDFSKPLTYQQAVESAGRSVRYIPGMNEELFRKFRQQKTDSTGNPFWSVPLPPSERIIRDIRTYQENVYPLDETGNILYLYDENGFILYDEWGNPLTVTPMEVKDVTDTLWETVYDQSVATLYDQARTMLPDTIRHDGIGNITGLRFYESWYLDAANFSLCKKVTGIGLVVEAEHHFPAELYERCLYYNSSPGGVEPSINEHEKLQFRTIYFELNP